MLEADDRATIPLLRDEEGRRRPVDWHTAIRAMARRFRSIQEVHGPDAIAFLSTGQIATEEMALLGSLAKFGMGIVHGDGNTRQCMATAVVAYKQAFGFDAPPYTYQDFEESDCIVLVGSNLCIAHPILWERVMRNRRQPEIIVVDPRRTETAEAATLHLPVRPKSDLTLLYGLANLMIQNGWIDGPFIAAHTSGFANFAAFVRPFDADRVAAETGLSVAAIRDAARRIHEAVARLVLVDDGREPEPSGRQDRAGDHQPRTPHRQHRPTRHGRQLDHRPVQRDGFPAVLEHDQPAGRARLLES